MSDEKSWLDRRPSKGRFWLIVGIALAAVLFLLWEEHRVHLLGALPWMVLLGACLLMHGLMHGGHGGHGGGSHKEDRDE